MWRLWIFVSLSCVRAWLSNRQRVLLSCWYWLKTSDHRIVWFSHNLDIFMRFILYIIGHDNLFVSSTFVRANIVWRLCISVLFVYILAGNSCGFLCRFLLNIVKTICKCFVSILFTGINTRFYSIPVELLYYLYFRFTFFIWTKMNRYCNVLNDFVGLHWLCFYSVSIWLSSLWKQNTNRWIWTTGPALMPKHVKRECFCFERSYF